MSEPRHDQSEDLVNRAVAATRQLPLPGGPSAALALQTLAAVREAASRPKTTFLQRIHQMPWTSKTIAALATAASLLAVYIGVSSVTNSALAFSDVLQKIRQASTMVCDLVTTYSAEKGQLPDMLAKTTQRGTIAMKLDGTKPAECITYEWSGVKSRLLFLGDKAYAWADGKVQVINRAKAQQQAGTEDWLGRLLALRESPDRQLGEKRIHGRRATGFEIAGWKLGVGTRPTKANPTPADTKSSVRVWVDAENNLPVRLEIEQPLEVWPNGKVIIHQRWDNIRWNVALNPDQFKPPSNEELAKAETVQLPPIDETAFINGMRAWLDWKDNATAGIEILKKKAQEKHEEIPPQVSALVKSADLDAGYPERLDWGWLSGAFSARASLAEIKENLQELKPVPPGLNKQERAKWISARGKEGAMAAVQASSKAMLKATAVATFYKMLANEQQEPEYFGATVKPGDSKAILLRWKLGDGTYRVIYGDLRAATLDSAR
jgi:hypothetical protein